MLRDVEDTYWDLYLPTAYDTNVEARTSFLRRGFCACQQGVGKFSDLDEAQAREAYSKPRRRRKRPADIYRLEPKCAGCAGCQRRRSYHSSSDDPTTGETSRLEHLPAER